MNIKQLDFEGFYIKKETRKSQITLHHTAGGGKAIDVANYWKTIINKKTGLPQKICTSYIIEKDGTVVQLFDTIYGGGHIGDCAREFKLLNLSEITLGPYAIGIEIISWGFLQMRNNKLYNGAGKEFKGDFIKLDKKYKGFEYFEKYTAEQLKAVQELLPAISAKHNISLRYNEDIWDINTRALTLQNGLFTHNSYRLDKSDVYPDPDLINILTTF